MLCIRFQNRSRRVGELPRAVAKPQAVFTRSPSSEIKRMKPCRPCQCNKQRLIWRDRRRRRSSCAPRPCQRNKQRLIQQDRRRKRSSCIGKTPVHWPIPQTAALPHRHKQRAPQPTGLPSHMPMPCWPVLWRRRKERCTPHVN